MQPCLQSRTGEGEHKPALAETNISSDRWLRRTGLHWHSPTAPLRERLLWGRCFLSGPPCSSQQPREVVIILPLHKEEAGGGGRLNNWLKTRWEAPGSTAASASSAAPSCHHATATHSHPAFGAPAISSNEGLF